ncbi:MAG: hypothetical protein Q4A85_06575 [Kingella sp. (in: b-proteobacteria)]|nr:hypothetical protein [Kingella sp. (in: b-proteobacteria)]
MVFRNGWMPFQAAFVFRLPIGWVIGRRAVAVPFWFSGCLNSGGGILGSLKTRLSPALALCAEKAECKSACLHGSVGIALGQNQNGFGFHQCAAR